MVGPEGVILLKAGKKAIIVGENGLRITVDENTTFLDETHEPLPFAELMKDDQVSYTLSSTDNLRAEIVVVQGRRRKHAQTSTPSLSQPHSSTQHQIQNTATAVGRQSERAHGDVDSSSGSASGGVRVASVDPYADLNDQINDISILDSAERPAEWDDVEVVTDGSAFHPPAEPPQPLMGVERDLRDRHVAVEPQVMPGNYFANRDDFVSPSRDPVEQEPLLRPPPGHPRSGGGVSGSVPPLIPGGQNSRPAPTTVYARPQMPPQPQRLINAGDRQYRAGFVGSSNNNAVRQSVPRTIAYQEHQLQQYNRPPPQYDRPPPQIHGLARSQEPRQPTHNTGYPSSLFATRPAPGGGGGFENSVIINTSDVPPAAPQQSTYTSNRGPVSPPPASPALGTQTPLSMDSVKEVISLVDMIKNNRNMSEAEKSQIFERAPNVMQYYMEHIRRTNAER